MKREKLYCIARAENRYNSPDLVRFATEDWADTGDYTTAEDAGFFTAAEIAAMIGEIEAARATPWVSNGCYATDDILIISAGIAERIAARNYDMSLYDWEDYNGDDDPDAQGSWCEAEDTALVRENALTWREIALDDRDPGPATPEQKARLVAAGYSPDDAADARVIAEAADGAAWYEISPCDNAVEGATGDIIPGLAEVEAFREWFA